MRNIHRELSEAPEAYMFNAGCSSGMYKNLTAMVISRLETILTGSEEFSSEEAWLMRSDLVSLINTLKTVTGAIPSALSFLPEQLEQVPNKVYKKKVDA